jgi:para-nitrobenzyl esterase
MKRFTVVAAAISCAAASLLLQAQPVEKPVGAIQTTGGLIAGMVLPSGVKAWYGVPFAKPPTGNLRWQGVWNADRMMPECMQVLRPHNINHYFGEEATSEDCLYMNVWAPGSASATSRLPVIAFIYGGGGTIGTSGSPLYGGENIAKHNAVYVNFNYRVGVLGFMAHPELTREQSGHSGNYAYLDQNAALKWIHDNIARFGGDPDKVVVMGQSAGAGSVVQQIYSPLSKGLFRGAVMSSGCTAGSARGTSLAEGEKNGLDIQTHLGAANLAEMRNIPADKIIAAQTENQLGISVTGIRASGIIDGYFTPKTQIATLQAHEVNDVPMIASFNHDEAAGPLQNATTVAEYEAIAKKMYGADAAAFLAAYPVRSADDIKRVGGQVAREAGLETNARNCAAMQAQYAKSKTYIDTFSRKHPYAPGVKIADQNTDTIGAYHTGDIPYWFGTQDAFNSIRTTRNWTPWDRELAEKMMASLIAFANTGNPATNDVKWTAWSGDNEVKMEFGSSKIETVKLNTAGMDWLKAHPAQPVDAAGSNRGTGFPRD